MDLVISAWSAASPFGMGVQAYLAGLRAGRPTRAPLDPQVWPGPQREGCLIPGFDVAHALGRKGTRSMDRATGIAVATTGLLLDDIGADTDRAPMGLVLGTDSGSVQSTIDFTVDSLTRERPYHVDPARFPNTVMNRAAGQCAIWHGLKGPNATVAAGAVTGLLALNYAVRLLRSGHCAAVLAGAVEEFSVQRSWLDRHARPADAASEPLGEGCAMFLVEIASHARRGGRREVARLGALRFAFAANGTPMREALARCAAGALADSGLDPADVAVVAPSAPGGALGAEEEAGLAAVFGDARPCRV
ncbi:MAG: 3-oxoacyl-ACP synthase, partial [Actinomadura rubrobrunea]|nr:3-oxoacyl-ACP synthase [Actinomadura rubrobrunea]